MSSIHIYVLTDPRTGDVRYVGKAVDLAARLEAHIREFERGCANCLKSEWFSDMQLDRVFPQMVAIELGPRGKERELEIKWINYFDNEGADLTNIHHSRRTQTFCPSAETRRQLDDLMGLWNENQTQALSRAIERVWLMEMSEGLTRIGNWRRISNEES